MNNSNVKPANKTRNNVVQFRAIQKGQHSAASQETKRVKTMHSDKVSSKAQNNEEIMSDAFIIMRVNELNVLEETFGRSVAKELADLVTKRLQHCLRSVDVLERISANEFAIMITDIKSKNNIEKLVQRIETECCGEYVCADLRLQISVTAGVSIATEHASLYDEQLRYARIALRHASRKVDSVVEFFSLSMLDSMQGRAAMIFDLRKALKEQRFVLHYQPQYAVDTQETIAVEALIRLEGQDGKLLYPDSFIDLAEETGLILPIGHWVIQEACQQYKKWQELGCAPRYIAVNVSPKQLADNSLIEIIDTAIEEAGIEHKNLEIEITEQHLIKHMAQAEKILNTLRAKGVRIAIDDFGTGYSSLAYLGKLPLNVLKVDRSFLQQLDDNERAAGLIRSMVYIAKELDLEVVVEGVETPAHQQFIQEIGCQIGQGYGYSRPQSAQVITDMLNPQQVKLPNIG